MLVIESAIHKKDSTTSCILGRSTYRPQIYRDCMGIWWRITLKMYSEQYMNSIVKALGKRVYSPNWRNLAMLENVQSGF